MSLITTFDRSLDRDDLVRLATTALLAGVAADLAWEVWARALTPLWVGGPLQPAALIQSVFGFNNWPLAEAIHAFVGVVAYPLGYLLVALPLARRVGSALGVALPWPIVAAGFGVGLWVFALYVMAHLFAGLPPFLGFIALTWASLVGHLVFGLVVGAVVALRR
ncbi:hypothetical protein [Acuticoccus sp.]|uniref:hypothetical protein n=1 Tax=Acuticoccus sp. TaxID=1904378 RepID=UPI003B51A581